MANSTQVNVGIKFRSDTKDVENSLNRLKKSLTEIQRIKITDFSGSEQQLKQIQESAKAVKTAIEDAFNPTLNTVNIQTFYKSLNTSGKTINGIKNDFAALGAQGSNAFADLTRQVFGTNLKLKQTHNLIDSMGKTMMNTVKWGIASSVMNTFTQSVQGAFQYVQSLEKSLTNIRIVTGDNTQRMAEFAQQANRAAQQLGRSTLDYTKSSLTFYQQGLDEQAVQARTEATLKAQNITGTGAEMADYLTSVWNGYRVANEQAELYVDKLAAVADSSASDMSQLAIAMSKVASTANTMGVDIDQLNAQIATVVATTRQAPESVGTAFKTIYTRMNDIKTGSDQAQISLGNYSSKMAGLGINVLDATGHLRDTGQVMEQIGARWQTMTRQQQIYLSTIMGGQRQVNQLMALFSNWTTYSELLNTSLDAQGTLNEKNARYMDSLGAKMEQLGAAGERIKDALINEDDVKGGVEALTNLTNLLANFIESLGGGRGALLALGGVLTQVFSPAIATELNQIATNAINAKQNIDLVAQAQHKLETYGTDFETVGGAGAHYVSNMRQLQTARQNRGMTNEEFNAQVDRADKILELEKEKTSLEENIKVAQDYFATWSRGEKDINKVDQEVINRRAQLLKQSSSQIKTLLSAIPTVEAGAGSAFSIDNNGKLSEDAQKLQIVINKIEQAKAKTSANGGDMSIFKKWTEALTQYQVELQNTKYGTDVNSATLADLGDAAITVAGKLDQASGAMRQYTSNTQKHTQVTEEARQAQRRFNEENEKALRQQTIQSYTKMAAGLGQVAAGISGVVNLTKIWKNENISTGEKILQTLTSATFTFGLLKNGISQLKQGYSTLSSAVLDFAMKKTVQSKLALSADEMQKLSQAQLQAMYKATGVSAWESLGPYLLIVGAVTAAVAVLAVGIYKVYEAWTAEAKAAQKAAKTAADAKKTYNDLKTSLDELKKSLEDLHTAEDNLDNLTRGTQQWKDALQEVNNQVLDLIAKYPELAQYVQNTNGRLSLNAEGEQAYLDKRTAGVQNARNASQIAASQSREADARAAAASIGHRVGTNAQSAGDEGGYASADQIITVVQALNSAIARGVEKSGWIAAIAEATGYTDTFVAAVLANTEQVGKLRTQLQQNELADNLLYQTMAQSELAENGSYNRLDDTDKAVMDALAGEGLQQRTKEIADTLTDKYNDNLSIWSQNTNKTLRQLLADYNAANGTNWTLDSNAVRGMDGSRSFAFRDESGAEQVKGLTEVVDTIAAKKALEEFGQTADQAAESLKSINAMGDDAAGLKQFISTNGTNLTEKEAQQLSGQTPEELYQRFVDTFGSQEVFETFAKTAGKQSGQDFVQQYLQAIENNKEGFAQIGQTAFNSVKEALEDSDLDDVVLSTQRDMQSAYTKVFSQSGSKALDALQSILAANKDKGDVASLFANADLTTIEGLNDLESSLKGIGAEAILATEQWRIFKSQVRNTQFQNPVDSIFEQQGQLQEIVGGLKRYDVISEEDLETLAAADEKIRDLFARTAEGYQFVGSKPNLMKLIAGSVPDYIEAADRLNSLMGIGDKVAKTFTEDFDVEKASGRQLRGQTDKVTTVLGDNEAAYNALGFSKESLEEAQQQIEDFYNLPARERATDAAKAQYEAATQYVRGFLAQAEKMPEVLQRDTEAMQRAGALNAQTLSELVSYLDKGKITGEQFGEALALVSRREMENLGFDPEQYETYVELLQATNEEYRENEYLARSVAQANMRISEGTQDLIDNWDDYNDAIQDYIASGGDVGAIAEQWQDLSNTLANLFDMDQDTFDLLGPDFVADNLAKIEAVKNGTEGAYEDLSNTITSQLQQAFANSINEDTLDLTAGQAAQRFTNIWGASVDQQLYTTKQQIFNALDEINQDANIEVGAVVDDANLIAGLNNMIEASSLASDQMEAIISAMGYDVKFKQVQPSVQEEDLSGTYLQPAQYTIVPVGDQHIGGTTGIGYPVEQVVATPAEYRDIPGGKGQTYKPGAYAIETLTKNGKGSGGNISRSVAKAPSNHKSKGGKGGGGGGGSQPKAPKKQAGVKTKTDPYRKVNNALGRSERQIKKVREQQEKLMGKDYIDSLTKEQEILDKQIELHKEKLALLQQEKAQLVSQLEQDGYQLQFDENGTLSNYNEILTQATARANAEIARYNQMSAEEQEKDENKKIVENAKARLKAVEDALKRIDEITEKAALEQAEQLAELFNKQLEANLKKFNYTIDLKLDLGDAKREYNDFKKNYIDKIGEDDIINNNRYIRRDLASYNDENRALTSHIEDVRKEIDIIQNGGVSNIYGTNINKALEDLNKYTDAAKKNIQDIYGKVDELRESMFDAIDQVQDRFNNQQDEYDFIDDMIDHGKKVTELLYGDDAYGQMNQFYKQAQDNGKKQLEFQYGQTQIWQQRMNDARRRMNNASDEKTREHYKKLLEEYESNYMDSVKNLNSTLQDQIQTIIDKYTNAVQKAFDSVEKALTNGKGFDYLETEWDLMDQYTDRYLDKVDSLYEIGNLDKAYEDAIQNAAGNPKAQQALANLRESELKYLKDKDKLTQYDVDRANKMLEIETKRLALENARNNKSKLRLRRDSQGNYTYQYVADDTDVSKAEQELNKLNKQLWDMSRDTYKEDLSDFNKAMTGLLQELQQIDEDVTLSVEEKAQRKTMAIERYKPLIEQIGSQIQTVAGNLPGDYLNDLSSALGEAVQMTPGQLTAAVQEAIPQMSSGIAEMFDNVMSNGIDQYINKLLVDVQAAQQEMEASKEEVEKLTKQDLDNPQGISKVLSNTIKSFMEGNQTLLEDNKKFLSDVTTQVENTIRKLVDENPILTGLIETTDENMRYSTALAEVASNAAAAIKPLQDLWATLNKYKDILSDEDKAAIQSYVGQQFDTEETYPGVGMATGGYTGSWGNNGKLALLHEKELVLNEQDTANILSAVNVVRTMEGMLNNIKLNTDIINGHVVPVSQQGAAAVDQQVKIQAHFPNVTAQKEIEKAFENLVNQAYQYANRR